MSSDQHKNKSSAKTGKFWFWDLPGKGDTSESSGADAIPAISFRASDIPEEKIDQQFLQLQQKLQSAANAAPSGSSGLQRALHTRTGFGPLIYRVAASLTLLLVVSACIWIYLHTPASQYRTPYGATKRITLPDGSVVVLNANSSLKLSPDWPESQSREVWLTGEAFFSVVHTARHQPFLVHSHDNTVEVLGTEFTVAGRRGRVRVVLNSGRVKLRTRHNEQVTMKPGELVDVADTARHYLKKSVDPAVFSSWTNQKLVFNGTPLSEIVLLLEDTYGVKVEVADTALLNRKVWGATPADDLDVLLTGLSQSVEVQITRSGKQVRIDEE